MSGPIQKCEELTPPSPPGAYDGRWKWAAVADIGGSLNVLSVITPSSGDDAQAESSHAITKPSIPQQAERLFTEPNLLIAGADATTGIRGWVIKEMRDEKFCAEREARL